MLVKKGENVLLNWVITKSDPGSAYTVDNIKMLRTLPDGSCQEVDLTIQNSTPTVDGYLRAYVLASWVGLYQCVLSGISDSGGDTVYSGVDDIFFNVIETATSIDGKPVLANLA